MFVCSFSSVSFYLFVSSSSLVSVGFLGCVVLAVGLYCDSFLSQAFFHYWDEDSFIESTWNLSTLGID